MNDDVVFSIQQMVGSWRTICDENSSRTLASDDGIEYLFSGIPIAFFNVALLTQHSVSGDALKSHGHDACVWASSKEVPWFFILTNETVEAGIDAVAILDDCGLAPIILLTGMQAQQVSPVTNIPQGLEFTVPQNDAGCMAIFDVNSAAYGSDLKAGKEALGKHSFWKNHFPVLGLVGGEPVCSAAVIMINGYRYVAMVATNPDQQRRGYADATVRHALEISASVHGEQPTVLHATDAGRPVYERMGYTTIATHTIFMEKRFLADH